VGDERVKGEKKPIEKTVSAKSATDYQKQGKQQHPIGSRA
jgi:hypothetical protein